MQGPVRNETGRGGVKASHFFLALFLSPQIQSIFFYLYGIGRSDSGSPVRLIAYLYSPSTGILVVGNRRAVNAPTLQVRESEFPAPLTRSFFDFFLPLGFGFLGFWANWLPVEQEIRPFHIARLIAAKCYAARRGQQQGTFLAWQCQGNGIIMGLCASPLHQDR